MRQLNPLGRQHGLTLMELMITLSLIVILSLLSVPLAQGWSDSARAQLGRDLLMQGLARAQALALRNPVGATGNDIAATLVISSSGKLCVYTGLPTKLDCSGTPDWTTQADVIVQLDNCNDAQVQQCLVLNRNGLAQTQSIDGKNCQSTLKYCAKKGDQNVSGQL